MEIRSSQFWFRLNMRLIESCWIYKSKKMSTKREDALVGSMMKTKSRMRRRNCRRSLLLISKLWNSTNKNSSKPTNLIVFENNRTWISPKDSNPNNLKINYIDKSRPLRRYKDLRKCSSVIWETKSTWGITRLDRVLMRNMGAVLARTPMILALRQFNSKLSDPHTRLPSGRTRISLMFPGWCQSSVLELVKHLLVRARLITVREIDMLRWITALTPVSNCPKRREMINSLIPCSVIQRLSIAPLTLITNR